MENYPTQNLPCTSYQYLYRQVHYNTYAFGQLQQPSYNNTVPTTKQCYRVTSPQHVRLQRILFCAKKNFGFLFVFLLCSRRLPTPSRTSRRRRESCTYYYDTTVQPNVSIIYYYYCLLIIKKNRFICFFRRFH